MIFRPKFQHPPPENWQDFELLCWNLWRDVWRDENTQRHGRIGQSQQGVDIYGRPNKGQKLAGVQCKGKENFTNQTLSEKELIEEVEKAKGFTPPLSEYIIATTAPRDGKIQKVAREITRLHKSANLFSVTVYGWDDIDALLILHKPKLARLWYSDIDDGKSKVEIAQILRNVLKEEREAVTLQGVGKNVVSTIPNSQGKPSNKIETSTPSGQSQINIDTSNSNDDKGKPPTVTEIQAVLRILPSLVSAALSGGRAEGQSSSDATFASALAQAAGGTKPPDIYSSTLGKQKEHPYEDPQHPQSPIQSSLQNEILPSDMPVQQQTPCTSTATSEAPRHPIETIKTTSTASHIDCLAIIDQIRQELAVWNYDEALVLAKKIEDAFNSGRLTAEVIVPSLLILLARVYIIQTETKRSSENHIERAKSMLTQAEKLINGNDSEQMADIEALRASIDNLEGKTDVALSRLAGRQDPYAIRIRIGILLNQERFKEAVEVIDGLQPHERWCDLATIVYAASSQNDKAKDIADWAANLHDRTRYLQCVVRWADVLLVRALMRHKKGQNIQPRDLSEEEREKLLHVIETLKPVLDPLIAAGKLDSELGACAVKIAWQANHLLQRHQNIATLTNLMYTRKPVPLDVARSVLSGYIQPPADLPDRLRQEHAGDLDANILAVLVQSSSMGQHNEAFTKARELVPLANTDEKKDELAKIFQQIWQELDGNNATECERIADSLVKHNAKLRAMFKAATLLRQEKADAAIQVLDTEKNQEIAYWLQLYANALIQKQQLETAANYLLMASKKTFDPTILHKTGDLAVKAKKTDIAVWCYEQLIKIWPQNMMVRGNLAHIYTFVLHDMEKAEIQFRALHNAEPENPIHTMNLAICLVQLYKPEESLVLYEQICKSEKPHIRAVLGRAELLLSLANPDKAFASLDDFRSDFWDVPNFLLAYMNSAYAAGKETQAHEAFMALNKLREVGDIDPKAFQMLNTDEVLEMFKQSQKQEQDRTQHLHSEMLKGRMPWVWAEQVAGNAIYLGWRRRTCEVTWINDAPENRANFCIYATNAFHAFKSERDLCELAPLVCPPAGTKIVADISSLITLHKLGLLEAVADYFGEIAVPAGYLPTVLEDSRKLVLHQRSRQQSAEQLIKKIQAGQVIAEEQAKVNMLPVADEYGESNDHRYHMTDLIQSVHQAGLISDAERDRISKICAKLSGVDENHPKLQQFQKIAIDLSTFETLTNFGLLEAITGYFKVYITKQASAEIQQRLDAIKYQEETRQWHLDLWNRIRADSRFHIEPHNVSEKIKQKDADMKDYLPFFASFIAQGKKMPLLADDRVCQALAFAEIPDLEYASFGTDTIILALMDAGKLKPVEAATLIRQLMVWRYRFILPSANILKALAEQYRNNPPGKVLQEIAEYAHDCMRDSGLFGGPEKTEKGESMAMSLYFSWVTTIAEFLILVWHDESFREDIARRLTEWSMQELLPSPPRVLLGRMKTNISSLTSMLLISRALIQSSMLSKSTRMPEAMKAIKDSLKIKDEEYHRIVTGILNETKNAKF